MKIYNVFYVKKILKNTSSILFRKFSPGDCIAIECDLNPPGCGARNRTYAKRMKITHVPSGQSRLVTFNQAWVLKNFEFSQELKDEDVKKMTANSNKKVWAI